jgi:competence protein ComEC
VSKWDMILWKSKIELIKNFWDFEYKKFLLAKNIYFKSFFYSIEKVWTNKQNIILKKIDFVRQKLLDTIFELYPKQEAIFLGWILLWARENLPKELKQNFNNSGLTHFIAVSWFNIAILIAFFSYIFKWIPIYFRTILIISLIVLFTFLVWFSIPVLRASIMWSLAFVIMAFWRKTELFTLVFFVWFVLVLFAPLSLNYDVSFALSFLAVFWIIYTQKFWTKIFWFVPETLALREAFVMTMSALSFTLPIMLFNFGQISILAPLSNVLVTFSIPIAMLLWFLSIIFYLIFPLFWYIIWFLAYIFLSWDIWVVNFIWSLDFSVLKYNFQELKYYIEFLYFFVLIFIVLYFKE